MFDSHTTVIRTGNTVHNVNHNSVSGTLVKSTPLSKIIRINQKSDLAKKFFDENNPHRIKKERVRNEYHSGVRDEYYNREIVIPIIILQVMLMANEELMIEYIDDTNIEGSS